MKSYNESYDPNSDSKVAQYTSEIEEFDVKIEKIEKRLLDIDNEEVLATDKCRNYL